MSKKLTSKEILKLPKEDFIRYVEQQTEEYYQNLTSLGNQEYEKYSFEEKIGFWSEDLNRQMRLQVESGLDPYAIFKRKWYLAMKRLEPEFDAIIDKVFEKYSYYNWDWKKVEYLRRILE